MHCHNATCCLLQKESHSPMELHTMKPEESSMLRDSTTPRCYVWDLHAIAVLPSAGGDSLDIGTIQSRSAMHMGPTVQFRAPLPTSHACLTPIILVMHFLSLLHSLHRLTYPAAGILLVITSSSSHPIISEWPSLSKVKL